MKARRWVRSAVLLGLAGCLGIGLADAQVRTQSRHAESDREKRQAEANRQELRRLEQLEALFDDAEFEAMLELGDGSLSGVMGYAEKHPDAIVALLRRPTVAVADREFVFLLPMTRYVEAWYEANARQVVRKSLQTLDPRSWKYMGMARTDTEGNFAFDGLRPGRYVVFSEFPVGFVVATQHDTGERAISFHGAFGNITGATSRPVYERRSHTETSILVVGQAVEVAAGRPTRYRPVAERP